MKTCTLEEITDRLIGKAGTPRRDAFDLQLKMDLAAEAEKEKRKERVRLSANASAGNVAHVAAG